MTVRELIAALGAFPGDTEFVTVFDGFAPSVPDTLTLTTYAERFPEVDDRDEAIVVFD